ncbi:hypothetical protein HRI_002073300 [Hibiscus trionum]|uniref:CCHC-type domain-containing protein n=1 Tax=Hibiscus trionum TaxID=183268 RepID=A0A9W7HY33_HIBTR|nr:hypothetical protein HRI_002073300 [Hibiscus trionum]
MCPDIECHDLGKNMFLFVFSSPEERLKVLGQRPWSIQDRLLILKEWLPDKTFKEIDFKLEEFWVQIHDMHVALIIQENLKKIGNIFPAFYGSTLNEDKKVQWNGEVSIRVALRVEDPLKHGLILNRKKASPLEINFKYERLPLFCFKCGRIGHNEKDCWFDVSLFKTTGRYGPWLRANGGRHNKSGSSKFLASNKPKRKAGIDKGKDKLAIRPRKVSADARDVTSELTPKFVVRGLVISKSPKFNTTVSLNGKGKYEVSQDVQTMENNLGDSCSLNHVEILPPVKDKPTTLLNGSEPSPLLHDDLWGEFIAEGLKVVAVSNRYKRKRESEPVEPFYASKKREIWNKVQEEIVQVGPGNWCIGERGMAADEELLKLALFPNPFLSTSTTFCKIESEKKGSPRELNA